jgi:hypothetical protein
MWMICFADLLSTNLPRLPRLTNRTDCPYLVFQISIVWVVIAFPFFGTLSVSSVKSQSQANSGVI